MAEPAVPFEILDTSSIVPEVRHIYVADNTDGAAIQIMYHDIRALGELLVNWADEHLQTLPHGVVVKVR